MAIDTRQSRVFSRLSQVLSRAARVVARTASPSVLLRAGSLATGIAHLGMIGQSNILGQGLTNNAEGSVNMTVAYAPVSIETSNSFTPPPLVARTSLAPYAGGAVPGCGYELALGRMLIDMGAATGDASNPFPITKIGVNGSDIDTWILDANFDRVIAALRAAELATGRAVTHLLWGQGEADAGDAAKSAAYQARLETIYAKLVAALGSQIVFIVLKLNAAASAAPITAPWRDAVRAAQVAFCAAHPTTTFLIDQDWQELSSDNVHYDAEGYWNVGLYIAQRMARWHGIRLRNETRTAGVPFVRGGPLDLTGAARAALQACTKYSGTVSAIIPCHAPPTEANDTQYLVVSAAGIAALTITLPVAAGFTQVSTTQTSLAGGVTQYCAVFSRSVTQAALDAVDGYRLADPTIDTGTQAQRRRAFIFCVGGVGTAAHQTAGLVSNANTTAVTFPAVTTTLDNCLILACHTGHASSVPDAVSGLANANQTNLTLVRDMDAPYQAKLALVTGDLAAQGSSGITSGLHAFNTNQANLVVAAAA